MKSILLFTIGTLLFLGACQQTPVAEEKQQEDKSGPKDISFMTPDSIKIFGDLYESNRNGTTILLFHQGGSNTRGEYVSIIPRLLEQGYNILAIDQRVGGQIYGNYNRTIANIPDNSFDNNYGYCDAYNNLEGALDFITTSGFSGKKVLWGSSYSASLAIQLANQRQQEVDGVLAFSPASGNSMTDCLPNPYFETLKVPLLILRPPNEMESDRSKAQFELATKYNHQTFVPEHGVHGSSMLVEERVKNKVDETWKVVLSFLRKV